MDSSTPVTIEELTEEQAASELARLALEVADHDTRYWEEAAPSITDSDYDTLKQRNAVIETRFPHLMREDSPSLKDELRYANRSAKGGPAAPTISVTLDPADSIEGHALRAAYPIEDWPPAPEQKVNRAGFAGGHLV